MKKLSMDQLNRPDIQEFREVPKNPLILVLDDLRSMHNIGSIFRTADALAVQEILLCGLTAQPPHREIEKTALGATQSVAWQYFQEKSQAIAYLKSQNALLFAIEQTDLSVDLRLYSPNENQTHAYIFGNEVLGVSEEFLQASHQAIEIPQMGTKHSFNVANAASIVLWHAFLKLHPAG